MAIKLEKVVEKFYQGLEEGKFLGRKCPACGAVRHWERKPKIPNPTS